MVFLIRPLLLGNLRIEDSHPGSLKISLLHIRLVFVAGEVKTMYLEGKQLN